MKAGQWSPEQEERAQQLWDAANGHPLRDANLRRLLSGSDLSGPTEKTSGGSTKATRR